MTGRKLNICHSISFKDVGADPACTWRRRCAPATGAGISPASDGRFISRGTDPQGHGERFGLLYAVEKKGANANGLQSSAALPAYAAVGGEGFLPPPATCRS